VTFRIQLERTVVRFRSLQKRRKPITESRLLLLLLRLQDKNFKELASLSSIKIKVVNLNQFSSLKLKEFCQAITPNHITIDTDTLADAQMDQQI